MVSLPDGLAVVVKRDCPTCELITPVLRQLAGGREPLTVLTQDDPSFPPGISGVIDDTALESSWRLNIETVPTVIRIKGGRESARVFGWHRGEWETLTGVRGLGEGLPAERPGCGSKTVDPGMVDELELRYGGVSFASRPVEIGGYEDDVEACFERDWSDGLPVVPPTPVRVLRMLRGTTRDPKEVLGMMPPDYPACTVEKVAINAVMAGCKPEYMPVLLAAVEAALDDRFCLHGVIATTMYIGPIMIVNGPARRQLGMNSGVNALGQGNRANSTIGRALQLTIRNVGGGKPGGVDRATLGNPGKLGFCFAEDEEGMSWDPLSVEHGIARGKSAVTLFAGYGVQGVVDQNSRTPESLAKSFAMALSSTAHPKTYPGPDVFIVCSPEHHRVFRDAGWSKARLKEELHRLCVVEADKVMRDVDGCAVGVPAKLAGKTLHKFRPGGLNIVHAGGTAGLFSGLLVGWGAHAEINSQPVTKEVRG
ncbi:MAG: thioredoxin family protein [Reyranellaceae bacterium]